MVAKSTLAFAVLAVSAQFAAATPPACLLQAINTQPSPGDLNAVCGSGQADVLKYINSYCGPLVGGATSAFADACKAVGKTVSTSTTSGSTTGSTTGISTGTSTGTGASSTKTSSVYSYGGTNVTSTAVATSTYYDQSCGCVKTAVVGPTGFSTAKGTEGPGAGPSATAAGSPTKASGAATGPSSTFTGAASKNAAGALGAVVAIAGLAMAL